MCAAGHALKALRIQLGNNHTAVFRQEVQSVPENAVSPTVGSAAPVGGAGPDPLAGPAVRAGLRRLPLHGPQGQGLGSKLQRPLLRPHHLWSFFFFLPSHAPFFFSPFCFALVLVEISACISLFVFRQIFPLVCSWAFLFCLGALDVRASSSCSSRLPQAPPWHHLISLEHPRLTRVTSRVGWVDQMGRSRSSRGKRVRAANPKSSSPRCLKSLRSFDPPPP